MMISFSRNRPYFTRAISIDVWLAFLWIAFAISWRILYALLRSHPHGDELMYSSSTTFAILRDGEFPLYQIGTDYVMPLQEYVSSVVMRVFDPSLLALRLPAIVFSGLSVGINYLLMRRFCSRLWASGIALCLVFANSACLEYSALAIGEYGACALMLAWINIATFRVDEQRCLKRWFALGIAGGVSRYVFGITILQLAVNLVWLFVRSPNVQAFFNDARSDRHSRIISRCITGCFIVGSLSLGIANYRSLTRPNFYVLSSHEKALELVGIVAYIIGSVSLWRAAKAKANVLIVAFFLLAPIVVVPAIPKNYFQQYSRNRIERLYGKTYSVGYVLKPYNQWGNQAVLLFEQVLPKALIGNAAETGRGLTKQNDLGWKGLMLGVALLLIFGAYIRRVQQGTSNDDGRILPHVGEEWIFLGSFGLSLLVLLPSWRLFGDSSYRYIVPFLPGFYLGMALLLKSTSELDRSSHSIRLSTTPPRATKILFSSAVIVYICYSFYDGVAHRPLSSEAQQNRLRQAATSIGAFGADTVVAPTRLAYQLQWYSAGRLRAVPVDTLAKSPDPNRLQLNINGKRKEVISFVEIPVLQRKKWLGYRIQQPALLFQGELPEKQRPNYAVSIYSLHNSGLR